MMAFIQAFLPGPDPRAQGGEGHGSGRARRGRRGTVAAAPRCKQSCNRARAKEGRHPPDHKCSKCSSKCSSRACRKLQTENQQLRAGPRKAVRRSPRWRAQGENATRRGRQGKLEAQLAADEAVEAARIKAEADAQARFNRR